MNKHGGKREGAGRKASPNSRSVPKSIRVSQEIADYLGKVGTGVIEEMIRKSKSFKEWRKLDRPTESVQSR